MHVARGWYRKGNEGISHGTKSNINAVAMLKNGRRIFRRVTEELVTAVQES